MMTLPAAAPIAICRRRPAIVNEMRPRRRAMAAIGAPIRGGVMPRLDDAGREANLRAGIITDDWPRHQQPLIIGWRRPSGESRLQRRRIAALRPVAPTASRPTACHAYGQAKPMTPPP